MSTQCEVNMENLCVQEYRLASTDVLQVVTEGPLDERSWLTYTSEFC
jgi:hypothetical protein